MSNTSTTDRLADSVNDAAHRLGVSRAFLYKQIRAGQLASLKAGKRRLITREAQQAYLAKLSAA
jgi:excisionase family DNA binding protein